MSSSAPATAAASLLDGPALPSPDGIASQVTNRSGAQSWYFVVMTLCTTVPGVLLLLRLYTRMRIFRKVDFVDGAVVLAFLSFLVMGIIGRKTVTEGAAVHMWNLQLKHYINMQYVLLPNHSSQSPALTARQWLYISEIIYGPTIFFVKLAILLQYLQLFAPTKIINPTMFIVARLIIVVTMVFVIISTCLTAVSCSPREKIWNPLITDGRCLNNNASILVSCVYNIIIDVTILLLPTRAVWKLQMPRKRKFGIVLLFAIGLLACVANIMIIYYMTRMMGPSADISYNAAWFGFWVYAEICLGIMVPCMLSLPKFVEAKGAKVHKVFSNVAKPFKSFPAITTLIRSTKTESSKSDGATQDPFADSQTHSETDLVYHPYGHDLEASRFPHQQTAIAMT